MINVTLTQESNLPPEMMASHAAKICYAADVPEIGSMIDVKGRLFDTGHHTTLQHSYFTFTLDNISVAACTFGLHLSSPFYNSDQRSGRFSKMYNAPDFESIEQYITHFYPEVDTKPVMDFVKKGADIYAQNINPLSALAARAIKAERPFANEKYIENNAPKFAQEQLRSFISLVAPTALDFTVDLSALSALYRAAWTPEMREVTQKMADAVIQKHPEVSYMFDANKRAAVDWAVSVLSDVSSVKTSPEFKLLAVNLDDDIATLSEKDTVDTLHFAPQSMDDNINHIITQVEISAATMGQDQRHRSVRRGKPSLTGSMYVPPLLQEGGLEKKALEYMQEFLDLSKKIPSTLAMTLMPYGSMVRYKKLTSVNALKHEQGKRTCWCAQEEIYHISTALRQALALDAQGQKLVPLLCPPCFNGGKCAEGPRFCGRQIKGISHADYFSKRRI